jgi:hypothetical protein
MAESKSKTHEAVVAELPPDLPKENVGEGDPLSNMPTVKVSGSDTPDPDPRHAGPDKLGRPARDDPNAALRAARGVGPGLQDSEIINPAVWVDVAGSKEGRKASADAHVAEAELALERAKRRARAIEKGEPMDRDVP